MQYSENLRSNVVRILAIRDFREIEDVKKKNVHTIIFIFIIHFGSLTKTANIRYLSDYNIQP